MHVGTSVTSALIEQKQKRWIDKGWHSSSDEHDFQNHQWAINSEKLV